MSMDFQNPRSLGRGGCQDSAKGSPAYVRQLEHGSFTTTWPRLVRDVGTGECMCTTAELLDMAYACMQRLAQRGATAKLAA